MPANRLHTGPVMVTVHALGITQITAWGTSYYCLGVLAGPISTETGWGSSFVYLGFTVALLAMGLASTAIGRQIDAYGAQRVMTLGAAIVAVSLAALACVQSQAAYLAVWALLGMGMRCCLYDAAFVALVQVDPSRGRLAISYLTLYGAFASSIFWTIGHYLNQWGSWRQTLMVFAMINLAVCVPLNWWGLRKRVRAIPGSNTDPTQKPASPDGPALEGRARSTGVVLFALIMSLNAFVFGVVSLQLVPLLEASGLAAATAVWIASLKGVAQFAGRVVEIVFARNLRAITVARIAIGVLPFSLVLLLLSAGNFAAVLTFTLLMGASQGVITIVRGAVPLALFGAQGYGAVLGVIATPVLIVNAVSPTIFALIVDRWGWHTAQIALLTCAAASWLAMEVMSRWYATHGARVPPVTR